MVETTRQAHSSRTNIFIAFFTALRFLTVIPIRWKAESDGDLFQKCIYFFPVIGLLIGCGAFLLGKIAISLFSGMVCSVLLCVYLSAISGFLHIDGLADSGDGLFSARPKERSLEIMKDSRIGAMGVVLLVFVLLGKFAALSSISKSYLPIAVLILPLAGRCSILITMAMYPYARPEGGIGGMFYSNRARFAALIGIAILLVICLLTTSLITTAYIVFALGFTVFCFASFCKTKIGGVTGDTLGAVCELTETVVAISLTIPMGIV